MIFRHKNKYSPEEIESIISKAVIEIQETGFMILPRDVPNDVIERISEINKQNNSRERIDLWRERRHNRRWV